MSKLKQLYQKEQGRWILSAGITLIFFSIVFFTLDIKFTTNDDARIMYALAGYASGDPYPGQSFINYFLGLLISLFYMIVPFVPWYFVYHVVAMFISETVIFYCFYKIAFRKQMSLWFPVCLQVFSLIFVFLISLVSIQFSVTSTILGTSAVVVMASKEFTDEARTQYSIYFYCVIAMLFSFMTRSLSWYCVMCFFILSCFYQVMRLYLYYPNVSKKYKDHHLILISLFIIVLGGSCFFARTTSRLIKNSSEITQEYNEYNDFRVEYMDYKQYLPYEQHEELYKKIGWDHEVYRATLCLLYLDENINETAFQTVTETYKEYSPNSLRKALSNMKTLFKDYHFVRLSFFGVLFMFGYMYYLSSKNPRHRFHMLTGLCCCGGCAVLVLYLAYSGRFPLRSYQTVLIPCFALMMILFLRNQTKQTKRHYRLYVITAAVFSFFSFYMLYFDKDYAKTQTVTEATYEQFQAFEEYAVERQNNFYLYDFTAGTVNRNPFVVYTDKKPINTMVSGGSFTFSELYYKQLAANGLSSLYWKDMVKDNIYYVSANPEFVNLVKLNIERELNTTIKIETVKLFGENVNGISIYKFRVDNSSNKQ